VTTSTAVVSWLGPRHSRDENRVGAAAAAFRSILGGHHCSLRELQLHLKARRVDLWVALASTRKSGCERAASGCAPKGDDGPPHVPHRTLHFYRRLELQARSSTYCSLLNFSGLSPAARIRLNGWLRVCRDCVLLRRRCSGSCPQSQRGITPSENPAQDADRYAGVTTRTPGSLGAKRTKTTEATQTQR